MMSNFFTNWKLFLDDLRDPPDDSWVVARSCEEAEEFILRFGFPDEISFDHDLGENVETGFDFTKKIVDADISANGKLIPTSFQYNVHSANPCGAANISGLLKNYLKKRTIDE